MAQLLAEQSRVLLEVDAVDGRVRREAGPLDDDQLEPLPQAGALARPRRAPARDAPVHEHDPLHERYPSDVTKSGGIDGNKRSSAVTNSPAATGMLRARWSRLRAPRSTLPAQAGLLVATTAASIGVGSLVGWAAGNWAYGALGGAVVGLPAGVAAVYKTYGDAFK